MDSNSEKTLNEILTAIENDVLYLDQLLQSLIQCYPTYMSDGDGIKRAQAIVQKELEMMGFKVHEADSSETEIRRNPAYVKVESWGQAFETYSPTTNPSLIGRLTVDTKLKTLGLNGHIDVEPVFDPISWKSPNLWKSGEIIEDVYLGRGATDMLGGVVGMLVGLKHVLGSSIKPTTNILFHSVADEEVGGNGTLKCLMEGPKPDWVIIAEPTGLSINNAALGFHHFKIKCKGISVHMSQAIPGQGAIDVAMEVYRRITETRSIFQKIISGSKGFEQTSLNPLVFGRIRGGEDPAIPADSCMIEGVMFSAPEQAKEEVKQILEYALRDFDQSQVVLTMSEMSFPGGAMANPYITDLIKSAGEVLGLKISETGFSSPCDLRLYTQQGIPTTVFGPGKLKDAHTTNEGLDRKELIKFCKLFATFVVMLWSSKT